MKHLILGLPLTLALLTACGGPISPTGATQPITNTPVATTQPTMINGTITGYAGGTASIDLKDNITNATVATGSVSAAGTFTLTLPSASTITPYLTSIKESDLLPIGQYTCTGNFLNSNPASKLFAVGVLYIGADPYTTAQTAYSSANQTGTGSYFLWFYTDQATTFVGTQTCTKKDIEVGEYSSTINVTFTVPLQVGWNLVREDASGTRDDTKKAVSAQVAFATVNDQTSVWKIQTTAQPLGLKNEAVEVSALKDALNLH